jgi:predicted nucleic acid-binding protein
VIRNVLVDAGPLAALINPRDQWHDWARAQLEEIIPPLLTCEAALSEAYFLAERAKQGAGGISDFIHRDVVRLDLVLKDHFGYVAALMDRYANVPMSLADGCLVLMSELVADCVVFTLDGDFRIYRRNRRQTIPLLIPPTL